MHGPCAHISDIISHGTKEGSEWQVTERHTGQLENMKVMKQLLILQEQVNELQKEVYYLKQQNSWLFRAWETQLHDNINLYSE